jgi:hypothetical protein
MKGLEATVILFPATRHVSVRAVAAELAALPPRARASAWAKHAHRLLRSRSTSGASRDAVLADVFAFRDAVRVLVRYLEGDPARSEDRA